MRAVVYSGRAVLRGRAAGLHQASAYVLWADDSGRVGAVDVQACRSSFAAVWSVAAEADPFGKLGPPKIFGVGCAARDSFLSPFLQDSPGLTREPVYPPPGGSPMCGNNWG